MVIYWIYRVLPESLRMINYFNEIEGFVRMNYLISVEAVLNIHVRGVRIKSFLI